MSKRLTTSSLWYAYLFYASHRPAIAEANGVAWSLFANDDERIKATDEMIAENRAKFPHLQTAGAEKDFHSKVNPLLCSKFVYIVDEGFFYIFCHCNL